MSTFECVAVLGPGICRYTACRTLIQGTEKSMATLEDITNEKQ